MRLDMPSNTISALIEQRTGLSVATRFRSDFEYILKQVADNNLPGLLQTLQRTKETDPTWQALLAALTIGETYFFRDQVNFRLLRERLLPDTIHQRRDQRRLQLNIWCAGCATGEEPYSVAITLLGLLPDLPDWTLNIIGTDINNAALEQAHTGIYRDWAFRHNTPDFQTRYFDPVDEGWQIKPHIRQLVTFQPANLLNGPPLTGLDFVFCRNVLIYLTRDQIPELEAMFHQALVPGGWLLLGQAEALRSRRERWMTHVFPGSVLYQKRLGTQPFTRRYRKPPLPMPETTSPPPANVNEQYDLALAALHSEQPDEAERILCELLADQPDHAAGHILLAYIFANRQAVPEAQTHLDAALRNDSMLSDAHYLRATLYIENGQMAEAEQSLRDTLYCRRDHPLATFMMGNLLAQAGDMHRASRAWQAAHTLVNDLPPDDRISDLSDMTATTFSTLIQTQLASLNGQG